VSRTVAVIGAGVAGCAAACAAARAGARVVLLERTRQLGGAAVAAGHRSICGLAPLDAAVPDLLEPELVEPWLARVAIGAPERRGRVWLWPCTPDTWQRALRDGLRDSGVDLQLGARVVQLAQVEQGFHLQHDGGALNVDRVIDASGEACAAILLGLRVQERARQWGAQRSELALDDADDRRLRGGLPARTRALRLIATALGAAPAIALEPIAPRRWLLSIDAPPGSAAADRAALAERAAAAIGARVLAQTWRCGERDGAAPAAALTLDELFAQRERGLCWASWPCEAHRDGTVQWRYPPADRYGVPERVLRPPGAPPGLSFVGKGAAVDADAAAALRVTGICLALGGSAGRLAGVGSW